MRERGLFPPSPATRDIWFAVFTSENLGRLHRPYRGGASR